MWCCAANLDKYNAAGDEFPALAADGPCQPQPALAAGQPRFGWGAAGSQVKVEPPNPSDPAFMQTVAPSGTSWGQYVRTGSSFVDPRTGFLAGPWAECIAWAVLFEHANDWGSMPQYAADGVVGGVLEALDMALQGRPNKDQVMQAAQKLEDASHALAERGEPLPAISQVLMVPQSAQPGQPCRIENPQSPGTYITVNMPQTARPGHPMMVPLPVQPNKAGGMSTGGKVALAAGGAVAAGTLAASAYYGSTAMGGGLGIPGPLAGVLGTAGQVIGGVAGDAAGFAGDAAGAVGDWAPGAAETIGEWAGGAAGDAAGAVGDWAPGAAETIGEWAGGAAGDVAQWAPGAAGDIGEFAGVAFDEVGDWAGDAGDLFEGLF